MDTYSQHFNYTNDDQDADCKDDLIFKPSTPTPKWPLCIALWALCISKPRLGPFRFIFFIFSSVCLSAILLPLIIFSVAFFGILRQIVALILKCKLSTKFAGLMEGPDTLWAIEEDKSKSIITTALIIKFEETAEELVETVKEFLNETFLNGPIEKLSCTRHSAFGYQYLLKNEIKLDECVEFIETKCYLDANSLRDTVSEYCNQPMPQNNTALWQVLLFNNPIDWSTKCQTYAIIFRVHHSLADGISLVRFFLNHFSDSSEKEWYECFHKKSISNRLKNWFVYFTAFIFGPAVVTIRMLLRPIDKSSLHGADLNGKKLTAFVVEKEGDGYLSMVKNIRLLFPKLRFSDVVNAAVSASFDDFYKKKNEKSPEHLTAVIPAIIKNPTKLPQEGLHNLFSVGLLTLPINFPKSEDVATRIEKVQTETKALRSAPDYLVNYWLLNIITAVLPESILRPCLYSRHATLTISIMPGSDRVEIFKGKDLLDVIFWIPHRSTTGIGLSVLSYDHRFQIGLTMDSAFVKSSEDVQMILDQIFQKIEEFHMTLVKKFIP